MRLETAGVKTWLAGALALWALLAWGLALVGMGGRIQPLEDDPSLMGALPQAGNLPPERLGPLAQYPEIADRPLFTSDRRPKEFLINPDGEGEAEDTFDFVLTSVLLTPGLQMAILQPTGGGESVRLKVGDAPDGARNWRLSTLSPRSVVFDGPEGEKTLELRVFNGQGGEAPTQVAAAPQPGAAQPRTPPSARAGPPGQAPANAVPPPAQGQAPPSGAIAVTTSSSPNARAVEVPNVGQAPQGEAAQTSEAQVEAIRQRIEARRAQMRERRNQQGQQPPAEVP